MRRITGSNSSRLRSSWQPHPRRGRLHEGHLPHRAFRGEADDNDQRTKPTILDIYDQMAKAISVF